ncbi:MAG: hypothetical protein ACJ746_17680 [Bryobacteraceae bacterium]
MKAEAVCCLTAGEEAELFVDGGNGRWRSLSFGLRVIGTTLRALRMPECRLMRAEAVQS